jgi:FAD/FMN-containing dehydrogenase
LTAFELVPEMGLAAAVAEIGVARPITTVSDWYLLARFSGSVPVDDKVTRFLGEAVEAGLLLDAVVADTAAQEENLWRLRDELPPETLIDCKGAKFDAAVPIDRIVDLQLGVEAIAGEICGPDAVVFSFGHLGDGNLHVYVLPSLDRGGRLAPELVAATTAAVDDLIWSLGGTISAEHGVGQDLLVRLAGQKSEVELDLMRRLKKALDPDDMFNPGRGAHCVVAVPVHPEGGAHP